MQIPVETTAAKVAWQRARIKVLDPLTSLGPSVEAELLSFSDADYQLHVPRWIIPGSTVQILTSKRVVLGRVWLSTDDGHGFEVHVAVEPPND
jgi:hypothetical protein